jgi:hypothetical protein
MTTVYMGETSIIRTQFHYYSGHAVYFKGNPDIFGNIYFFIMGIHIHTTLMITE